MDKVTFLGVIIDNKLSWEPRVGNLTKNINSSIFLIKRIFKFIPKSKYMNTHDVPIVSISSWEVIANSKLLIRAGYYASCVYIRTYQDYKSPKNYFVEHTKPLFNKH